MNNEACYSSTANYNIHIESWRGVYDYKKAQGCLLINFFQHENYKIIHKYLLDLLIGTDRQWNGCHHSCTCCLGPKGQRRDARGFWRHGPYFVLCQRGWWMTSLYALHQNKQGGSLDSWAFNSASNQRTCRWTLNKLSVLMWGECIQIGPAIVLFDYFGHMHSLGSIKTLIQPNI